MNCERSVGKRGRVRLEDAPDRDCRNRARRPVEPDQLEVRHRVRRDGLPAGVTTPGFDRHGRYGRKEAAARRIAGDDPSGSSVGLEEYGRHRGIGERSGGPKPARYAVLLDALEKQHVSGALSPPRRGNRRRAFPQLKLISKTIRRGARSARRRIRQAWRARGTWLMLRARLRPSRACGGRHPSRPCDTRSRASMFRCSQPIEARSRPDDQSPFRRLQISPHRIEQSEPDLAFELLSQRGQRQQRHRNCAKAAEDQTSDHSASLHARPIATPIWFVVPGAPRAAARRLCALAPASM